ncbi:BNR repeat-containing protein [Alteromonas sp. H39]|uniref:BNR repeat-containing protein n=1 Tax=Alteromonas sp. H39 TaxID=3389876 RepID=UPI0039E005E3
MSSIDFSPKEILKKLLVHSDLEFNVVYLLLRSIVEEDKKGLSNLTFLKCRLEQLGFSNSDIKWFFLAILQYKKNVFNTFLFHEYDSQFFSDALATFSGETYNEFDSILSRNNYKPELFINIKILGKVALGHAWSGTSVNTVIFRQESIVTIDKIQFTAFYASPSILRIISRNTVTGSVATYDLEGTYRLQDAHNSISIGIDRDRYIHISYEHHGSRLKYRRTEKPLCISSWTSELSMTSNKEDKVTYPTFILPENESPLMMLYRDGNWRSGTAYLKWYDENTLCWYDYPHPILSGATNSPWTSNAYWNNPVKDSYGNLHLSYCWRTDYFDESLLVNNINIGYAVSYDDGFHWYSSNNKGYKLPITQVNSEVICPIPPCSNLMNQTSMVVDSKGSPHVITYANDRTGVPQYLHIYYNGHEWVKNVVSNHTTKFNIQGGGTLPVPISRPEVLIDEYDNLYIIHSGIETEYKLSLTFLQAPLYIFRNENIQQLYDYPVGFSEPVVDKKRWYSEGILSLFVQYNEQPTGDLTERSFQLSSRASIVDLKISINRKNK